MPHSSWGGCQPAKVNKNFGVPTRYGLTHFPAGIRVEAEELVYRLVRETDMRGYHFGIPGNASYGCWGYYCRKIAGTEQYSYHTTCAVDINAPKNPQSSRLITDMPGWMPDLWNAYGFRWGGDYKTRPDAMHYEFLGSISEIIQMTQVARAKRLGEDRSTPPPTPQPEPTPKRKDDKVYFLVQGDGADKVTGQQWLIDPCGGKRKLRNVPERDYFLNQIVFFGGAVSIAGVGLNKNPLPHIWAQADVDAVADVTANVVDNTLRWYVAVKGGPAHEIVQQVLKDELQETPDKG